MPFLFGKSRIKIKSKYFKFIFIFVLFFVIFIFSDTSKAHAADRYWVGGTGNWGDTAHWSNGDGGSGGFSVPTSSDNVFFSAGSFSANGAVVTLNVVASTANLDFSGLDQTMTLTSTTNALNVYGALSLSTNLSVSFTYNSTAYLYLMATTSVNITSNGNTSSWNRIYFDGVGGTWTNQDNWVTTTPMLFLVNGTWDTNSKYIKINELRLGTGTKTLNLGSSLFELNNGIIFGTGTESSLTLNAGASRVLVSSGGWFRGGNKTFNIVELTYSGNGGGSTIGNFTCVDLIRTGTGSINDSLLLENNINVTGSLTLNGNNATNYRLLVASSAVGTQRTITVPSANVIASNVDFRDIRFQNSVDLSNIVGLSGDAGGNSGITFTTAQSQYFKHTSGAVSWSDSSKWFSDSSPRITLGRVPLPQDDVYFDANSFTGTSTLTVNVPRIGRSLDMSLVDDAVTMTLANSIESYGSYVLGNNITPAGNYVINLMGRDIFNLNPYSKTLYGFNIYSFNGKYLLQSNIIITGAIDHYYGIFDYNDFNVVAQFINHSRASLSSVYLGNGLIESQRFGSSSYANFGFKSDAVYAEGSTLKFNTLSGNDYIQFIGGGNTFNKLWVSGSHGGGYDITGSNTITEMIIDPGRKVRLTAGTTQQIGKLTAVGTALAPITITSVTSATHTLNYTSTGNVLGDYLNISYSNATPANKWYASNSTNNGNNSGWIFANTPDAPIGLSATAGDTEVYLSWTAGADNGTAIIDYIVDYKLNSDSNWSTFADGVSILTTATIIGLVNGTSYDFRITAVNSIGPGSSSSMASATPHSPLDRYWVGGTGNWSDTSHWANVSGGFGGQSVPTSTNNVYFSNESGTGMVTIDIIANMGDLTFSNISAITLSNSTYAFNVYGNLTLPTSNLTVSFSNTGLLYLKATTSVNITSNGNTSSWNRIYFDGVGGTWTNQDNWNTTGSGVDHGNGTWNTNDKTISVMTYVTRTGVKTLNLGSSTFNTTNDWTASFASSGFTLNQGTSTINCGGNFYGQNYTYYNVNLTKTTSSYIYQANTFNNLTVVKGANISAAVGFNANQTINGFLTLTGNNSTNYRLMVASTTIGTQRTITVPSANVIASNVDFRDIRFQNAVDLSNIAGLSGDAGGNSGITFTTAQPQYFKHTNGAVSWSDSSKWFSDSSPRTTLGRVPLPQDDVYFDANSFTGTSTLTVNAPRIGRSLDMSLVDDAVTMTLANSIESYGSHILGSNITPTGSYTRNLMGRGNYNLNTYGKTIYGFDSYAHNGVYTNQSNITISGGTTSFSINNGTFDFNDYDLSSNGLFRSSPGTTVYFGNGLFSTTYNSTNQVFGFSGTNYFENSTLKLSPTTGSGDITVNAGIYSFNKLWFSGTHTGNFNIAGSNTIAEMIIDPGRKVRLTAGTTQQIGKLTAVGTALAPITITSVTGATHTLNYTGASTVASDYLLLSYSTATPANKWYAGINSTNNGNNSGWIFASVPNVPTDLIATSGNMQVSLSWTAPNNNGSSITDYILDFKLSSEPTIWSTFSDGVSSNTTGIVNGLTNGLAYDFRVSAVNAVGQGNPSSTVSSTPATIPDAPIIGIANAGNAQASISFSPPISNGGSAITLYTATSNPGGISNTGLSSPIVVSGLTNGTPYTFTITATNALGTSPASSASNSVTPATTPDAPTAVQSTASNQQISLSWSAPVWNGGSSITDYVVEYKLSSESDWAIFSDGVSTGTTAVVNGLINGSLYDFRISAVNVMGQGNSSSVVSSTPITIPGAPITIVASRGNEEASISFLPPLSDGGSPITNYTVTSQPENHIETGPASPIVVTGLSNGTEYIFTVTATNIAGTGPSSLESNPVTPATVPDAPTSLAGTAGNAQVSLIWSAPVWNGGSPITDYVVEYKLSSDPTTWSIFSDGISNTTSAVVIGLINGSSYDFRVYAVSDVGQGSVSLETSAMPITIPDAPIIGIATPGNAQASISFSPPAFDGGSTINSYTVTSSPGNFVSTGNVSPIVVTGLSNGTSYTFMVTATNAVGESLPSDPTDPVTPVTVPDAPTEILATPGNAQASISFSPPAFDGGTPILNYTATSSSGNFTGTNNTSPVTVSGLSNGTTYTFTVTATNAVGTGQSSSVSNQVTLSIEPDPPVNLASTVLGSSIGLSWSAPISNGGSTIVDYVIEYKLTTGGVWSVFAEGTNTNTTITVTGLSNGTSYDFRVIAVNIIGEGLPSGIVSAIPGEPAQVLIQGFSDLTVSDIGTNVRITNEGSVEYEYQYVWCITQTVDNLCGGGDDIFSANAAKLIDNGENWDTTLSSTVLIPGDYYFHIGVTYGSKTSTAYQSFTAQATYPLAPLSPSAVAGNGEASISFSPPTFNGGSPVISYQVISNPGGITGNGNASPIVVNGLSNGTSYTFTVTATNALGTSGASVPSNVVIPMTVPDAPTGISAVAGDSEVTLSWLAPLYDGGSLIIDYIIEYKLSTDLIWSIFSDGISTETTATVTGLTNDLSYDFRVSAVNIIGPSLVDETNITLPADDNNQGGGNNNSGGYNPNFNQTPDAPQPQIELNPITPLVTVEELKEIKTKDNNLPNKKLTKNTITNKETKEPDIKINTNEIRSTPVEKTRILDIFKPKTEPDNNKEESSPLYIIIIIVIALGLIFWLIWFFIRRRKIKNML